MNRTKLPRWMVVAPVTTRRRIMDTRRRVAVTGIHDPTHYTDQGHMARCELDSHADTCVLGSNFKLIELTGEVVDVVPYHEEYDAKKDVPIVSAATAWTHTDTGETFILDYHQALWYGKEVANSLLNPNQMRFYGHRVSDDITDKDRRFGIEADNMLYIPFDMKGTVISFDSRVPTDQELQDCRHVTMTSDERWNPATVSLAAMRRLWSREEDIYWQISSFTVRADDRVSDSFEHHLLTDISDVYDDRRLAERMISAINIATHIRQDDVDRRDDADWQEDVRSVRMTAALTARDRHSRVTVEEVARKFKCGLETAKKTLKVTTQAGVRQALHPLHRRYRVDHLNLNRRRLNSTFHMDALQSKVKSLNGNSYANLFTNGKYTRVYPTAGKSSREFADSLTDFTDDVGIPDTVFCDLAPEYVGPRTPFMKEVRRLKIRMRNAEKGRTEKQNHKAEVEIRELKKQWKTRMVERKVPRRLWDYGLVYCAEVRSIISRGDDGRPGLEEVMGHTIDISEWLDFEFYDLVWYWDERKADMADDPKKIGRWLGIAHRVGSDMTYWILTQSGKVIARSTVQHVIHSEIRTDAIKKRVDDFDKAINARLDEANFVNDADNVYYLDDDLDSAMNTVDETKIPSDEEYGKMLTEDKDDVEDEMFDKYLNAELMIDRGGETVRGTVVKRAKNDAGDPIGRRHANPKMDTREYEVEFIDGTTERYSANIVAENIYSQCDSEGNQYLVLKEIVDHKSDESALRVGDGYTVGRNGNLHPKITTRGWKLLCEWKDGSTEWIALKEIQSTQAVGADCSCAFADWSQSAHLKYVLPGCSSISPTLRLRDMDSICNHAQGVRRLPQPSGT